MKALLFIVAAAIIMLVACDVKSKTEEGIPSTIHLVENPTYGEPKLYKFHDDTGKVTCYVNTWYTHTGGISCLRDESK